MNPFARALRIGKLAIPFIKELGPYAATIMGLIDSAADELDQPPDADEIARAEAKKLREREDAQDQEWFDYSFDLAHVAMSDADRGKLLSDRIRLDLWRALGADPPESLVALYQANIVAAVKVKLAQDGLKRAEKVRRKQSRIW